MSTLYYYNSSDTSINTNKLSDHACLHKQGQKPSQSIDLSKVTQLCGGEHPLQRDIRLHFHGSWLNGRGRRCRANRCSCDANGPTFLTREYDARPSAHPGRDRIGMCFSL